MGRETSFIVGFVKQANFALQAFNKVKKPLIAAGVLGGATYGASSLLKKTEDPEQSRLRQLRKQHALPYQQGIE